MGGWWSRAATAWRAADEAAVIRHLDQLTKAERYADQVKHLDAFYGRTPATVEAAIEVAPRTPTTAEQFLAAGLPLPSAARRLVDAADDAASVGLGPENAALRKWIESQPGVPTANPRGAAQTALGAIADSFDHAMAMKRAEAVDGMARRRAFIDAAPAAIAAASAAGIGGLAAADAIRHQRQWRRGNEAIDSLTSGVSAAGEPDISDYVPDMPEVAGLHYSPEEDFRLQDGPFSAADLVEEARPRPRLQGTYPGQRTLPRRAGGY